MRRLLLFIVAFVCALDLNASDDVVTVEAPNIARTDEYFNIQFVIKAKSLDSYSDPDFGGLDLIAGPIKSFSRSTSWVNGKVSNTTTHTITYSLIASKEGVYKIGPMKVVADGKSYATKPYPIEVVKERTSRRQTQNGTRQFVSDDVLLRMVVSDTEVYKGEPVVATVYIYGVDKVISYGNVSFPAFNGFWKQEVELGQVTPERVTFNGKVYDRMPICRYLLFPQKSGRLEIERMDVMTIVAAQPDRPSGDIFDMMFGGGHTVQLEHNVSTSPVAVVVKDFPRPSPAGFDGAVGSFDISSEVTSQRVNANSSTTLKVTVSGVGNLAIIGEPKVNVPSTFEVYPAKVKDDFTTTSKGVSGTRTYLYPLIPRAEGQYTIEPVKMSFFDASTGRYRTVSTKPIEMEVLKDPNGGAQPSVSDGGVVKKEDLAIIGKDIHFIRLGDPQLSERGRFFVWSAGYVAVLAGVTAAALGVLFYMRKRIKTMRDAVKVRNRRANKMALKRLCKSKGYMDDGKESLFYEETMRALYGYISDKLNIPVSDLSKDNIEERMIGGGIVQGDVEAMIKLLSDCELARYSSGASLNMGSVYQASLDIIGRFENRL